MADSPTKTIPQIRAILEKHEEAFRAAFTDENVSVLEAISDTLLNVIRSGHKILLCGNGGSAADAQHIAAEFIGRFKRNRPAYSAIALTTDTSILTAVSNDFGFENVFERQVEGLGSKGDAFIAISTSGNSKNVLRAVEKAKEMGVITIGFTGKEGGVLRRLADIAFHVPATDTSHIQEMHMTALHAVSENVEERLAQ
jgi:D-sedoheptulose 7-phosphate isomerase